MAEIVMKVGSAWRAKTPPRAPCEWCGKESNGRFRDKWACAGCAAKMSGYTLQKDVTAHLHEQSLELDPAN